MSHFLRSVYQGAIAAGWEPVDHRQFQGLPSQSLAFKRPGGKKGVCFARPEHSMSMQDMIETSNWCVPQGLRMVWFSDYDRIPYPHRREAPFVELISDGYVQPGQKEIHSIAVFVEQALTGWFRFSDDRKCWVWSNPKTDPEAIEKKKSRDREAQRTAKRDADMLRGR